MSPPPSSSRVSIWEWLQTLLLAANLTWTTLCLGGFLPQTTVVTYPLTGLLLAVHFLSRAMRDRARRAHRAGWLLLPFLIYAAINVAWVTPVRWLGWQDWLGWAQMIAVFWVVLNGVRSAPTRRVLIAILAGLGVIAVMMGCYQRFVNPSWMMLGREQADQFVNRASGSFGIPNSFAAFLLLLLPPAFGLTVRSENRPAVRRTAGVLAAVFALGIVLTVSRGAWISVALVAIVWPLVTGQVSLARRVGAAAGAIALVALIGGALYVASPVVRERFGYLVRDVGEKSRPVLWRASWQLFREHRALGSGAGGFNVLFEKYRPEQFSVEPHWAHNDYLNTLSDYGAVGFALFFGACGGIAVRCARRPRDEDARMDDVFGSRFFSATMAAGIAAFLLQLFVDFHLKIPALAMALAIVTALVVQVRWPASAGASPISAARRATFFGLALATVAGTAFLVLPVCEAEALRAEAHREIDRVAVHHPDAAGYRSALPLARGGLERAVTLDPANAQAWADLSFALSLVPQAEPERVGDQKWMTALGRDAEAAAGQALALTSVCGEFFIRRGIALDMQGRWLDAGNDFTAALTLNPTHALSWYYYAYHLSLDPRQRAMTDAALAFCLRLDPANTAGLALRKNLAISRPAP